MEKPLRYCLNQWRTRKSQKQQHISADLCEQRRRDSLAVFFKWWGSRHTMPVFIVFMSLHANKAEYKAEQHKGNDCWLTGKVYVPRLNDIFVLAPKKCANQKDSFLWGHMMFFWGWFEFS